MRLLLLTLLLQVKSQSLPVPPGKVKKFRCAFFNFSAEVGNQTGGWSYRGVETDVINTTHVRCIASHLTSFVVLVSIVPSVGEPVSGNVCTANLDGKCTTALLQYMLIILYIHIQYILFQSLQFFSLTSACSGLHHIHRLQHFFAVFACLHYILFSIEVSPKDYGPGS